jgi:hypothetical protein
MLAAVLAYVPQVVGDRDLAITIDPAAFQVVLLDQSSETLILFLPRRFWRRPPCIIATGMHGHHAAQGANGMACLMVPNRRIPYRGDSVAKYAAASFGCHAPVSRVSVLP